MSDELLVELEDYVKTLWSFTPVPLVYVNKAGVIMEVNNAFLKLFNIKENDVIGRVITDVWPEAARLHHTTLKKGSFNGDLLIGSLILKATSLIRKVNNKKVGYFLSLADITKQRIHERMISRQKDELQTILSSVGDGLMVIDSKGIIKVFNHSAELITGLKSEKVVGKKYRDFFKFMYEDGGKLNNFIERAIRTRRRTFIKKSTILKVGKKNIFIADSAAYIKGLDSVVVVFRDITKMRKAEEELLFNESKYLSLFNNSANGIILLDEKGFFMEANKSVFRILNLKKKNIANKSFIDVLKELGVDKEHLKKVCNTLKRAAKRKHRCKIRVFLKNINKFVEMHISSFRIHDKWIINVIASDLTDLINYQESLKESEERYRNLFVNADELIFNISPDLSLQDVNNSWINTLGYSRKESLKMKLIDIIDSSCRDDCEKMIKEALRDKRLSRVKGILIAKDGSKVFVEGSIMPMKVKGGVKGIWCVLTNVTDIIKQRRLRIEKEKAELSSKLRSQFFMRVSHELRHPLVPIVGYAGVMLDENPSDIQRGYLQKILRNANQLKDLINRIIDVASLESGEAALNLKKASLRRIINEVLEDFVTPIELKGLKLIKDLKVKATMELDEVRMKKALRNLLKNAVEFTDKGFVKVSLTKENDNYKLIIEDTGKGIKADELLSFNKGILLPEIGSRMYTHLKLGLVLSKLVIKAHGGEFVIKSTEGKGTKVIITLPSRRKI